jgi:hypothetical protein
VDSTLLICSWSLSNIKIQLNITVPQKYVFDFKKYIFPINTFTFHRLEYISWKYICILEVWITWFQKELATPRFKIPHMNSKKEILVPFRKILVLFRTTKDCHSCRSLFLVCHMCTLSWDLDMNTEQLCVDILQQLGWSSGKTLACDAGGGAEFKSRLLCLQLFHYDILGSPGSNLVFIIPFGIM